MKIPGNNIAAAEGEQYHGSADEEAGGGRGGGKHAKNLYLYSVRSNAIQF